MTYLRRVQGQEYINTPEMIYNKDIHQQLDTYKSELQKELSNILNYWLQNTPDVVNGGFWGKIDQDNQVIPGAPKGSVLNARILWSFSAAYNQRLDGVWLQMAHRAYEYIMDHFIDH